MINTFQSCQKPRSSKIYHNYAISTKNFDGNLLYQLFLSNTRKLKVQKQHKKLEIKIETKTQCRPLSRLMSKSQSTNKHNSQKSQEKANKLLRLITSQYEKKRQSTQLVCEKLKSQQVIQRQCPSSSQNFYDKILYKSMQSRKFQEIKERPQQIYSASQSIHLNNKTKRIFARKKQHIEIHDFVKPEKIQADPWAEGRLLQFSAQSITILSQNKIIYSYQGQVTRQIASLTKIMTCITTLFLAKKYQLDITKEQVKVTRKAAILNGTTAQLQIGDTLTIFDLLYAMMLPSGNDASQTLADFFDKYISQKNKQQSKKMMNITQKQKFKRQSTNSIKNVFSQGYFLKQMNNLALHLKMKNTNFDNPHGLSNKNNYSTSNDLAQLCHYAMKNQDFRNIVKSIDYQTKIYNTRQKMKRPIKWINTNKLLSLEDCQGIKTGITPTAGPCMAASFRKSNFNVIIVILNAKSKSKRFQQVKGLYQWALSQINL